MGGPLALTISSHTIQTRPAPWDRVNPLHAVTRSRRRGRRRGSRPPLARILDDRDFIAHAKDEAGAGTCGSSAHLLRCAHVSRTDRATRGAERPVESTNHVRDRSARTAHRRPRRRYCLRNFRPERDFCAVHWPWPSVHTPYRPGPRRGTACILCTRSPGPGDEVVVGALRRRWRASWTTEIASHMPRARPRVESSTSVLISCAARMYPA